MIATLFTWLGLMLLFLVLATGIAATAAHLFSYLRNKWCHLHHRNVAAGVATGAIIGITLVLFPQPKLMDVLVLSVVPVLIYLLYGIMGMVHLWLWRYKIAEMIAMLVNRARGCRECGHHRCCCHGGEDTERPEERTDGERTGEPE